METIGHRVSTLSPAGVYLPLLNTLNVINITHIRDVWSCSSATVQTPNVCRCRELN